MQRLGEFDNQYMSIQHQQMQRQDGWEASEKREDTIASIPKRFQWATFKTLELRARVKPESAYEQAETLAKLPAVLTGNAGFGKTCLGCALLRRFARTLGKTGHFADAIDLAYARRLHPLGKGEAPEVLAAMNAGVLFLDELGAEQGIDQTIEQIVRARHSHDRPTIFATPHSPTALVSRYGDGVARRIFEGASVIVLGAA